MVELQPLVGRWSISAQFPGAPASGEAGTVSFEWLKGRRFVIQRWESPDPFPSGLAIIGSGEERGRFHQHYFDSRGISRLYEMTLDERQWRVWRDDPDDFSQRFAGTLSDDGSTITGAWEKCMDGTTWEHDFELSYTRIE